MCAPTLGWRHFQQFMIRDRAEGQVHEVAFATPAQARIVHAGEPLPTDPSPQPTPEVLVALAEARAVIVGPSNPVISIWPILHVLGKAHAEIAAPVVCVSPIVGGEVVKGPTAAFLAAYDQPVSATGVVSFYEKVAPGLLDGLVADEPVRRPGNARDRHEHAGRCRLRARGRADGRVRCNACRVASRCICAPPRSSPSSAFRLPSSA